MTDTPRAQTTTTQAPSRAEGQLGRTPVRGPSHRAETKTAASDGWVGWLLFASMMMILAGSFQLIIGLTALLDSGYFVVGEGDLPITVDYTTWGWTHAGLGALAVAAAFGLLTGQMWARATGIALALLSAIVGLAFLPAYPWWCIAVITVDVLVIYAIAMHGEEMQTA
jgi:hypothetical protein